MDRKTLVEAAAKRLLTALNADPKDPNFKDTPARYAEWIMEHFPAQGEFGDALMELSQATFPSNYDGLVVQTGIRADGLCPHHLLPVRYQVAVGYLPEDMAIGLSKLTRIAQLCLSRVGIQEELTGFLANALRVALDTEDVAVVVQGEHMCMEVRGVRAHDSRTTTSAMLGRFLERDNELRVEFLSLVRNGGKP